MKAGYGANVEVLPNRLPGPDYFVHVPNGIYVVEFIGAEGTFFLGRAPKVVLWFLIAEGEHQGKRIPSYYNVESLNGRPGSRIRRPVFTIGWRAHLAVDMATLFPDEYSPDKLPTVIPEAEMSERRIRLKTRTTEKTHKGKKRPESFCYSVVDEVQGWVEDY